MNPFRWLREIERNKHIAIVARDVVRNERERIELNRKYSIPDEHRAPGSKDPMQRLEEQINLIDEEFES